MLKTVKDKKQLVDFCFYLSIAVLPFTLILYPITIGLLIVAYVSFGDKKQFLNRFKGKMPVWILIGFYLFHVLGLFFSTELGIDFGRIDTQLLLLVIPLVFLSIDLKLEQIETAKKVYMMACIVFCIFALITLFYNLIVNYEHRMNYNFVQTSMYHYHYPYDVVYLNAAYILLLFNSFLNKFKLITSLLFFTVIVLSGARMGLAIFMFITVVYLLMNFQRFINLKSILILSGVIILSIVLVKNSRYVNDKFFDSLSKIGFNTNQYVSDIGEKYHKVTLRQKLWSSAKTAFNQSSNKVLGYGPQGSREILNRIYEENEYGISGMNSHNQYLTTTLNNGILGVFILLTIFIVGFTSSLRIKSIQNVLLVLIIAIAFLTESMLERQKGIAIFTIILTLIFLESHLTKKKVQSN